MKNKIVYFPIKGLPRVISTEFPERYIHLEGKVFVNPNLDEVKRTPIEFWDAVGEKIVPIRDADRRRERAISTENTSIVHMQPDSVARGWARFEENAKILHAMLIDSYENVNENFAKVDFSMGTMFNDMKKTFLSQEKQIQELKSQIDNNKLKLLAAQSDCLEKLTKAFRVYTIIVCLIIILLGVFYGWHSAKV